MNIEDATTLGVFVFLLFFALNAAWLIIQIVQSFRHKPALHETYATKPEVNAVSERVTKLDGKLDKKFSELARSSSQSREKIYNSIRVVERETASLKAQNEFQTQIMGRLETKLSTLINKKNEF